MRGAFAAMCLALAVCLVLLLQIGRPVHAQLPVPSLAGHVTDQTATLSAEQRSSLEQALSAFESRKGTQLAVLLVASTAPEAIEPYALRVAEQWKLGRKKVDDGAILLVAKNDRTVRIEVGYGLEGALSDATSKRIIEETILPRFKQGDFYGGVQAGVGQMMQVIDGEPLPAAENAAGSSHSLQEIAPLLFVVALVAGGMLRSALGRLPGALVVGAIVGAVAWLVMGVLALSLFAGAAAALFTLLGGGRSQGSGGFSKGGPGGLGGGGFGGGGFRGGGGGFGGGGASGRW